MMAAVRSLFYPAAESVRPLAGKGRFPMLPSSERCTGAPIVRKGMTRAESRSAMTERPHTFRTGGKQEVDAYYNNAFQVSFDDQEAVEYIELSRDEPSYVTLYKGQNVFALRAEELLALISQDAAFDPNNWELGYAYVFPDLELAVWRPVLPEDADDPDGRYFSTIGVGKPGYFSHA